MAVLLQQRKDIEQQKRAFYFESIGIKVKKKGNVVVLSKKKAPNGTINLSFRFFREMMIC